MAKCVRTGTHSENRRDRVLDCRSSNTATEGVVQCRLSGRAREGKNDIDKLHIKTKKGKFHMNIMLINRLINKIYLLQQWLVCCEGRQKEL